MKTIGPTNYCDKCGNCSRCGECCAALLPITRKEEKRIRNYIKENKIEPEFFKDGKNINLQCCFYDRKNKKCKVYEVRPAICRSFKCNRNIEELEKEKMANHERAYWNNITNDKESNITDMRLLFYNDPRTLITILIHTFSNETMELTRKQFELLKQYLINGGQKELANSLKGDYE